MATCPVCKELVLTEWPHAHALATVRRPIARGTSDQGVLAGDLNSPRVEAHACGKAGCRASAAVEVSVPSYQQWACPEHLWWAFQLMRTWPVQMRPLNELDPYAEGAHELSAEPPSVSEDV